MDFFCCNLVILLFISFVTFGSSLYSLSLFVFPFFCTVILLLTFRIRTLVNLRLCISLDTSIHGRRAE